MTSMLSTARRQMPAEINVAIIGAGVVGLATACEVALKRQGVFVFEKSCTFGLGIDSPGLTTSLATSRHVAEMMKQFPEN